MATRATVRIDRIDVSTYTIPTDQPESDGTLAWDSTTLVLVEITAGNRRGLGYTYADRATAELVKGQLARLLVGHDAFAIAGAWDTMVRAVRNLGSRGIAAMAISAVDTALWDLKARLLDLSLLDLLGALRGGVPAYGSGGFTSYSIEELSEQLAGWVGQGFRRVKMKIGRHPEHDAERVASARAAIGAEADLFVDANGAYDRKQALAFAEVFSRYGVTWFEEPVSSDDLEGLRLVRDRGPAGMHVAAGEYGYMPVYFQRMLAAGAVDVLQADVTRCLGITGFLGVAALCLARSLPLSAHCAPQLHAHLGCALPSMRHIEYFHDHVRIESLLFDGALQPKDGELSPDRSRPGLGIELKREDARRFAA
jgi:L-alanine-DL-glutamate epimerase-like enolase superfamily enzyme